MDTFIIFDNGGKTLDRFTIINKETGDVFGIGKNSDTPNGAGKFCGNCVDHRIAMYGSGWSQKPLAKRVIKEEVENYINNAKLDPDWMGIEVNLNNLPANVQQYISHLALHIQSEGCPDANVVYMPKTSEIVSSSSGMY
jgi:hypothetical protein